MINDEPQPDPECKFCNGTGALWEGIPDGAGSFNGAECRACHCIEENARLMAMPDFVLEYFAPMQIGAKARRELLRRRNRQ